MRDRWLTGALLAGCLASCGDAESAYFVLRVHLPPANEDARFAQVRFQRAADDAPTLDQVQPLDPKLAGLREFAIEATGEAVAEPLTVTLATCADRDCDQRLSRESARFERAFYTGEVTEAELTLGALPATDLGACFVQGCGGRCDDTGEHFCER